MRALIIEDTAGDRRVLERTLTSLGIEHLSVETAAEGLRELRESDWRLVLVDLLLPDKVAALLGYLENDRLLRDRTIVITAIKPQFANRIVPARFPTLLKPVQLDLLIPIIRRMLSLEVSVVSSQ